MIANRIGRYLVFAVGLFGAMWTYFALRDLYHYWQLDARTLGKVQEAHVHALSTSSFDIVATYTYRWNEGSYTATSSLGKPYQLNPHSAQKAAKEVKGSSRAVYFNRRHPETSVLTREFPYKSVLQAGLTLGICLYLWILNLYYAPPNRGRRETKR